MIDPGMIDKELMEYFRELSPRDRRVMLDDLEEQDNLNQDVLQFCRKLYNERYTDPKDPEHRVDNWLWKMVYLPGLYSKRKMLRSPLRKEAGDGSGLVYGMGHAIYTLSDPRAVILKAKAEELAKEKGCLAEFKLYDAIERLTQGAFEEVRGKTKVMCANVDLYSGFIYKMLDIPKELYTPIFAIARVAGWCAHRIEELTVESKIIRPAYKSVTKKREYQKIDDRTE